MKIEKLKKLISKLPTKPGVYFFQDNNNGNIYIGKATSLKKRVLNYTKTEDSRIQKMVEMAKSLKYITTDSDIEALILESRYIKKHRPMFNVVMRDDKQYGYVAFSRSTGSRQAETFPKIFITHQPQTTAGGSLLSAQFIGPFTDVGALKSTLGYLRRIFPYCTCKQLHNNYCLNYHLDKCPGFCCLKKSSEQSQRTAENKRAYQKNINAIRNILSGKKKSLIKKLEKEMIAQAKNHNFQEAIKLRNKLGKLQRVFRNAQIIKDSKYIDISTYQYDNKTIKLLQKTLGLEKLPRRIEAYDIANIQGQNATGSMVVFINEKPDKNEYRKFKIHNVSTSQDGTLSNSDTGMLKEVLCRRFKHLEWPRPDLIIVDGGKQQLNAAIDAIQSRTSPGGPTLISVIALTKNERHSGVKLNTQNGEIVLATLPADVKNLILRINSEAHRFAINYYRKLHRKSLHPMSS